MMSLSALRLEHAEKRFLLQILSFYLGYSCSVLESFLELIELFTLHAILDPLNVLPELDLQLLQIYITQPNT